MGSVITAKRRFQRTLKGGTSKLATVFELWPKPRKKTQSTMGLKKLEKPASKKKYIRAGRNVPFFLQRSGTGQFHKPPKGGLSVLSSMCDAGDTSYGQPNQKYWLFVRAGDTLTHTPWKNSLIIRGGEGWIPQVQYSSGGQRCCCLGPLWGPSATFPRIGDEKAVFWSRNPQN